MNLSSNKYKRSSTVEELKMGERTYYENNVLFPSLACEGAAGLQMIGLCVLPAAIRIPTTEKRQTLSSIL